MNLKNLLLAFLILIAIAGIGIGISLYFQPGQSTFGVVIIVGAALLGAAGFISGLIDASDLVSRLVGGGQNAQRTETKSNVELIDASVDSRLSSYSEVEGVEHKEVYPKKGIVPEVKEDDSDK